MKLAVLFPGQGSQKVGMGLDLYEKSQAIKDLFTQADKICKYNISEIILNGPQDELNKTKNTQIAIVTVSAAFTIIIRNELKNININFMPIATAGHSLGEFSCLWFTGILDIENLIEIVSIRANLMHNAPSGSMAAVMNLDSNKIQNIINSNGLIEKVVIANYNSPNQIVIAGYKNELIKISELLKTEGARTIILPVSGAFHSPLMEEASKSFSAELDKLQLSRTAALEVPIYQNIDGNYSTDLKTIIEKLKKQMTSPVLWTQTVKNLVNNGVDTVVEVGPGKILTGLVKKINPDITCYNIYDLETLNQFVHIYKHELSTTKS